MKKKQHGLTITLASLSAATASIVAGAFVSQHAMASSDTPAEASVTIVASADGGEPIRCTFDDITLPGAGESVTASTDLDAPHAAAVIVGGSGLGTAEVGAVRIEGPGSIAPDAPEGGPIRVFTPEDVREGSPEECAAMRDSMPDGLPMPVLPPATAGADGAPTDVPRITGIVGSSGRAARPS